MASNGQPQINALGVPVENLADITISNIADVSSAWYLRLEADDKPGVMASITQRLSDHGIGMFSFLKYMGLCPNGSGTLHDLLPL